MAWFVTMCVGFLFELIGLGVAAFGLWQTWGANAQGRPFFSARIRGIPNWVRVRLLRRGPRTHSAGGTATGTVHVYGDAHGFVSQVFTEDMTLEAKLETAQANALRALENAAVAHQSAQAEKRAREHAVAAIESRLESTQETLQSFARGLVVDGVPLAVAGLAVAALGLLLQMVAGVATFDWVS